MEIPSMGDMFDSMMDEISYLISFEWTSDILEFFSGFFSNLSEFSPVGLIYGIIMVGLVFVFRGSIFSFVNSMGAGKIIWIPVFYIFAFGMGYVMGRKIWE